MSTENSDFEVQYELRTNNHGRINNRQEKVISSKNFGENFPLFVFKYLEVTKFATKWIFFCTIKNTHWDQRQVLVLFAKNFEKKSIKKNLTPNAYFGRWKYPLAFEVRELGPSMLTIALDKILWPLQTNHRTKSTEAFWANIPLR